MAPSDYNFEHFNVTFPAQYVAQVEINRPKKLNAFYEPMWMNLGAIFRKLSHDPDVRAIILTGAGDRAFTSGLDVQAASQGGALSQSDEVADGARKATQLRRHIQEFQDEISAVEKCEKPVIAVLHGISYGLAIDMTTCCDIRICARDTRFAVREVEIGLAADIGTLSRLPHANVPMSWVKEVCLTAREFTAEEALQVGFVSSVHESKGSALDRALELGKTLASKSPVAVQGTKEVLNFSRDHTVADGKLDLSAYNCVRLLTVDTQVSTISRFGMRACCRRRTCRMQCLLGSRSGRRPFRSYRMCASYALQGLNRVGNCLLEKRVTVLVITFLVRMLKLTFTCAGFQQAFYRSTNRRHHCCRRQIHP